MRPISEDALISLSGDRSGDRLLAVPFYDGTPVWDGPLPLSDWSIDWDRSRQVQGQLTVTVADEDGRLAPWMVDDPLGVGGARLVCSLLLGTSGEEIRLGQYRITVAEPAQSWRSQRVIREFDEQGLPVVTSEAPRWTSGGTVRVEAEDETVGVVLADFLAPEQVRVPGSILGEITRLLDGILTISVHPAVVDGTVPASISYDGNRADALGSLLRAIGAQARMSSDVQLEIFPAQAGAPVWRVEGGDDGVLVDFGRSYSARDFINAMVVEGKRPDGAPLIGVRRELEGPLRSSGPHGLVPARRQSDILTTQAAVDRAAATYLERAISDRAVVLPVTCLPNPALQVGDVVELVTPVGALSGPVETMRLSGSAHGMNPMQIGITVPFEQVQIIGSRLRRGV